MILKSVIRITESHREQHLKIFRKTGFARFAEWEKKYSYQKNKNSTEFPHGKRDVRHPAACGGAFFIRM